MQGQLPPVGQTAKTEAGHPDRMVPTFSTPNADPSTDAPEPRAVWASRLSPGGRRSQFRERSMNIPMKCLLWSLEKPLSVSALGTERKRALAAGRDCVCIYKFRSSRWF